MTVSTELAIPRRPTLAEKRDYAMSLAQADLLPGNFKKQPANVLWAIEYAEALRLPTIAAITGVHVMDGKPTPSAALMSALVRRAGHRLRLSHDPSPEHGAMGMAWCEIVRADDPSYTFRTEWTVERAVAAELCEIRNGKPFHRTLKGKTGNWQKYPVAMMKARALSECARDACEEALMGMHYTPEELGADVDADGDPIIIVGTATRTDQAPADPDWAAKSAPSVAAEPEAERHWDEEIRLAVEIGDADALRALWRAAKAARPADVDLRERIAAASSAIVVTDSHPEADEAVDAEIVDEPSPVTEKHNAHMHVMWGKAGVSREERLAVTGHLLGREITTSKDLTDPDAEIIIERLRAFDSAGKDALRDAVDRWLEQWATAQAASADAAGRP